MDDFLCWLYVSKRFRFSRSSKVAVVDWCGVIVVKCAQTVACKTHVIVTIPSTLPSNWRPNCLAASRRVIGGGVRYTIIVHIKRLHFACLHHPNACISLRTECSHRRQRQDTIRHERRWRPPPSRYPIPSSSSSSSKRFGTLRFRLSNYFRSVRASNACRQAAFTITLSMSISSSIFIQAKMWFAFDCQPVTQLALKLQQCTWNPETGSFWIKQLNQRLTSIRGNSIWNCICPTAKGLLQASQHDCQVSCEHAHNYLSAFFRSAYYLGLNAADEQ